MRSDYYVYAYLREDGSPYYVGKGTGRRAYQKSNRHKYVRVPEDRTRIVFLSENITEEEALAEERRIISHYGRKISGGILVNISEGGEIRGRPAGWKHDTETRKKMSENRKGKGGGRSAGFTHSEETKNKMSESRKGNQYTKGRNQSEEEKKKRSDSLKEYYRKRREAGYKR